jgi:tripartite-type tricarboxylate transporter receptor subunit TctC
MAKKAGRLDFGSGGPASIGTSTRADEDEAEFNMVHVPYRGGAPMTTDLIAGIVPWASTWSPPSVPYF